MSIKYDNQNFIFITAILQTIILGDFVVSRDKKIIQDNNFMPKTQQIGNKKTRSWGDIINTGSTILFILGAFSSLMYAANKSPNNNCDFTTTQVVLNIIAILSTGIIIVLLYTKWVKKDRIAFWLAL